MLLGSLHGIGGIPKACFGSWPLTAVLLCTALCVWLFGRQRGLDTARPKKGVVLRTEAVEKDILRVDVEAERGDLPIRSGQFFTMSFDEDEYPHPFSVTEVRTGEYDRIVFSVLIKALGRCTRRIQEEDLAGKTAFFHGPCGAFLERVPRGSLWVAGGIGISTFVSKMNDPRCRLEDVTLLWCFRSEEEKLSGEVADLCERRGVRFRPFNSAAGGRIRLGDQLNGPAPAEVFYCGPASLGRTLAGVLRRRGLGRLKTEHFSWRRGRTFGPGRKPRNVAMFFCQLKFRMESLTLASSGKASGENSSREGP